MDADLIEAAARLCGWKQGDYGGVPRWEDLLNWMNWHDELTDAGLLAVEAELRRRGWSFPALKGGPFCCESETSVVCNSDRATAACMAARVEVGDES